MTSTNRGWRRPPELPTRTYTPRQLDTAALACVATLLAITAGVVLLDPPHLVQLAGLPVVLGLLAVAVRLHELAHRRRWTP